MISTSLTMTIKRSVQFFEPNFRNFSYCGIAYGKRTRLMKIWSFFIISLVSGMLALEFVYLFNIFGDVVKMTNCSFMLFTFPVNMVKCYVLYRRKEEFLKLLDFMDSSQTQPQGEVEEEIFYGLLKFYKRLFYVCIVMGGFCGIYWVLRPMILDLGDELPASAYLPFNDTIPHMWTIFYGLQIVTINWHCHFDLNFDVFAAGLLAFLGIQLDILCHRLETKDANTFSQAYYHYTKLIEYAKIIQDLFNVVVFAQYACSILVFCSTFMQFAMLDNFLSIETGSLLLYLVALLTELFIYCWYGSEILDKSNAIGTSIFHSPWVDATPQEKGNYYLFMQLAQRPITLKVGGLIPMALPVYTAILRTSYSYFTVLGKIRIE